MHTVIYYWDVEHCDFPHSVGIINVTNQTSLYNTHATFLSLRHRYCSFFFSIVSNLSFNYSVLWLELCPWQLNSQYISSDLLEADIHLEDKRMFVTVSGVTVIIYTGGFCKYPYYEFRVVPIVTSLRMNNEIGEDRWLLRLLGAFHCLGQDNVCAPFLNLMDSTCSKQYNGALLKCAFGC